MGGAFCKNLIKHFLYMYLDMTLTFRDNFWQRVKIWKHHVSAGLCVKMQYFRSLIWQLLKFDWNKVFHRRFVPSLQNCYHAIHCRYFELWKSEHETIMPHTNLTVILHTCSTINKSVNLPSPPDVGPQNIPLVHYLSALHLVDVVFSPTVVLT